MRLGKQHCQEEKVRTPHHLRDFVLLPQLSNQIYFTNSRNLHLVRCEILNYQRFSILLWDNLPKITSIRGGSFGAMLSFIQQHSENGFLGEWHPALWATKR
jgi:hypothetical protein